MDDGLRAWLRGQLDEDEARTRELLSRAQQNVLLLKDPRMLGRFVPGWYDLPEVETMCAERLAEVAAVRRVLDLCEVQLAGQDANSSRFVLLTKQTPTPYDELTHVKTHGWELTGRVAALRQAVRVLAVPYAGRDGYREEWAP